jgi:tetratricopeptide (TPR) repeat protein
MKQETICPSCGAEIRSQSKFCSQCGHSVSRLVAQRPTHCPNPKCGVPLEGQEKFCPSCGERISANAPAGDLREEAPKRSETSPEGWRICVDYLKQNPQSEHAYAVTVIAETAKAFRALPAVLSKSVDFTLHNMQLPATNLVIPTPLPGLIIFPNKSQVPPVYVRKSLDTEEFKAVLGAIAPGASFTVSDLEKERDGALLGICRCFTEAVNNYLWATKTKCEQMLVDGKTRAILEEVTLDEFIEEADVYYKAFERKEPEKARKGFERLARLNPMDVYPHNMLHAIAYAKGDYEIALSEIVYASYLEDDFVKADAGHKRDINVAHNKANLLRNLGLYPALHMWFALSEIEPEKDFEDFLDDARYRQLIVNQCLGQVVTYGMANSSLISSILKKNPA